MTTEEIGDSTEKKKERKEAVKKEALELGISYKEMKERKKAEKSRKKKAREVESLQDPVDKKRMRSWSKDLDDPTESNGDSPKRRRTRSMDAKENNTVTSPSSISPTEWRKERGITIQGHGKFKGQDQSAFEDPFLTFKEVPFVDGVHKTFNDLGYTTPTDIQAQV